MYDRVKYCSIILSIMTIVAVVSVVCTTAPATTAAGKVTPAAEGAGWGDSVISTSFS